MIKHRQSTESRAWRRIALVTLALLFSLTFLGQSAMATYPWGEDPPIQANKPPGMDDHPWGNEHRQLNKPNTDTDDTPWADEQKQLNRPTTDTNPWGEQRQLNKPDDVTANLGFADVLLLWLY